MENNDLVYHYCSMDSFIKIVEEKSLKFSDIKKSNDRQEIEFFWQYYLGYIKRNNNQLSSSLQVFKNKQMEITDFLVCCFSDIKDALHLWKCYANKGVAIGFNKAFLIKWAERISFLNNGFYLRNDGEVGTAIFGDVEYYEKSKLESFVENQCKGVDLISDKFQDNFNRAPLCKTDFWKDEKEWRIILPAIYNDKTDLTALQDDVSVPTIFDIKALPDERFGFKTYCLIPFETSMIKNIVLAPNCNASISDIGKLLTANGFNTDKIQVEKSNGNLR